MRCNAGFTMDQKAQECAMTQCQLLLPKLQIAFNSEVFRIESRGEVADINSAVNFALELPAVAKEALKYAVFIEVDLYFSDAEAVGATSETTLRQTTNQQFKTLKFQQSRRFKLASIFDESHHLSQPVIHEHTAIQFDGIFWATCDMIVSVTSTGYIFRPIKTQKSASSRQNFINSGGLLDWFTSGAFGFENALFGDLESESATPELIEQLLVSGVDALEKLQISIALAQRKTATMQKLELPPLFPTAATLPPSRIISLISACLQTSLTPVFPPPLSLPSKPICDESLIDITKECSNMIKDFTIECKSDADIIFGFMRAAELVSSKLQCIWMMFSTSAAIVDEEDVKIMRFMSVSRKLKSDALAVINRPKNDFVFDILERIRDIRKTMDLIPFCQQDNDHLHSIIVVSENERTNVSESINGFLEAKKTAFLKQLSCPSSTQSTDSIHSFNSLLKKPFILHPEKHLIVFVHGFMGSSFDLRTYRNQIMHTFTCLGINISENVYLLSEANEGDTFNGIQVLADRLVSEIKIFIRERKLIIGRLSFVCHSLGGIIARCAIQSIAMDGLREKFDTFITLSSPHLSLYFQSNSLLASAMKLYQFVGVAKSIDQLNMRDNPDPRKCLLYIMALKEDIGLNKFKQVKFYGSQQDGYVALNSAIVNSSDLEKRLVSSNSSLPETITMIEACLEIANKLNSCKNIAKYSVDFGEDPDILDVLGRKAHVAMLTDTAFITVLVTMNNCN
ncbi:hypothetical protein HK100_001907 [Physocladia obscura]|uniref:DUF676 domain-containing protein n=1 Tax=Physocladia obscura TaxID=109957 RepID=A0AAD5SY64_9FUNG|nr:hypothetical protein HK100_001907 [Physocladia obscura]